MLVLKKEDSNLAKNYRPVGVSPIVSTIIERQLQKQTITTSCVIIERVIVLNCIGFNVRKMETCTTYKRIHHIQY